ncbi:MAG: VanZ family protein [uncultured bacterium]|nr:MAG: VanZ family protein [uncultured bacterium]KKP68513.1 MAG: hypothetical protein UR66_C0005G0060 [Candidatus Moranbacteria bacterium GW2011_GWE1_35_17]KKP72643.1 MAG: hypothetical protein UR65_C0013G0004 [Candidatus Moranbacteria bacterium GW2011_GWE2_35_164]KKP81796.1 MAG: hypothetical protein UR82_C0051G0002 [Candidatus Moranbacteria bacterium GW2011_GWF1_35_5]
MKKSKYLNFNFPKVNLLVVLLWMGVIFYFSSLQGDGVRYIHSIWFYVERKGAHVAEYLILAFLFIKLFKSGGLNKGKVFILSGVASMLYAFSDEFHQSFVFGREGKISDIGFDALGISLAIVIFEIFTKIRRGK